MSYESKNLIPKKIFEITVWATGRCNLRCKYCFVYRLYQQQPSSDMPPDVVEALVEFVMREGVRNPGIWWFGGEPLVAFDNVVKYAVEYCEKRGYKIGFGQDIRFGITTNATLITEKIAQFFRKYQFGVLLSIDGVKEKHDQYRVYANGKGSWDEAWRGLKLVRKYVTQNPQIRWTVAPATLEGLADDIKWFVDQGLTNLAVDWVYEVDWKEEDLQTLRKEMLKLRNYVIEWMRRGIPVMLKPIRDGIAPAVYHYRLSWKSRCGLGQGSLGADINGDLYPCHRFVSTHDKKLVIGNVTEGWYHEKRLKWIEHWIKHPPYSEKGLEKCRKCPFRISCHGGCLAVNYDLFGDIHIVPESYCNIMNVLAEVFLPMHHLLMAEQNQTYIQIYAKNNNV